MKDNFKKKITKNTAQYNASVHTPIKNKSNFNCYDMLLLAKTVKGNARIHILEKHIIIN